MRDWHNLLNDPTGHKYIAVNAIGRPEGGTESLLVM